MRHLNSGRKFKRTPAHRQMMLRNLATSLIEHERVETTLAKAKELRPYVEKLITTARGGWNLDKFRRALRIITIKDVAFKLFREIGPRFRDRPGGYTRIFKLAKVRQGDCSQMAVIMLLGEDESLKRQRPRKNRDAANAPA